MKIPTIKVGVYKKNIINISLHGDFFLEESSRIVNGKWKVHYNQGRLYVENEDEIIIVNNRFELYPLDIKNSYCTYEDQDDKTRSERKYYESVLLYIDQEEVGLINHISTRSYMISVLTDILKYSDNLIFLKSQAIVLRTWVFFRTRTEKAFKMDPIDENIEGSENEKINCLLNLEHEHYHVCATSHCYKYQGSIANPPEIVLHVIEETNSKVLMYDDMICEAPFSKCCGGITELYQNTWTSMEHPYIGKRHDSCKDTKVKLSDEKQFYSWVQNCMPSSNIPVNRKVNVEEPDKIYSPSSYEKYKWKVELSAKQITACVNENLRCDIGEILELKALERGTSGRIIKMFIKGERKECIIGKNLEIVKILSNNQLPSSAFIMDIIDDTEGKLIKIIFTGVGDGHGVGFCQVGALAMASEEMSEDVILAHYFPGATIKKFY